MEGNHVPKRDISEENVFLRKLYKALKKKYRPEYIRAVSDGNIPDIEIACQNPL